MLFDRGRSINVDTMEDTEDLFVDSLWDIQPFERVSLPEGAEFVVKSLVAKRILRLTFQEYFHRKEPIPLEPTRTIIQNFPGLCLEDQLINLLHPREYSDSVTTLYSILLVICSLQPPLELVKLIYFANETAIRQPEPQGLRLSLPLHVACKYNASDEVIMFLADKYPPALCTKSNQGSYPLFTLLNRHQDGKPIHLSTDLASYFLREHPTVLRMHSHENSQATPLLAAIHKNHHPVSLLSLLVKGWPESVMISNKFGFTPLHMACALQPHSIEVKAILEQTIQYLLPKASASILLRDSSFVRSTPLEYASRCQSLPIVQSIIEKAVETGQLIHENDSDSVLSIPATPPSGTTLLHEAAASNDDTGVVVYLGTKFPDMLTARQFRDGFLPLHLALVSGSSLEKIQALVRMAPETVLTEDARGRRPLDIYRLRTNSNENSQKVSDFLLEAMVLLQDPLAPISEQTPATFCPSVEDLPS